MLNASADYKLKVYEQVREFRGRATVDLLGTVTTYDDDTIVRMNILEEMSTLNDSVPSNELQLTMTNENGDFDLLNFQNMAQILASKPTIKTELGLLLFQLSEEDSFNINLAGKIYGSYVENPNKYLYRYTSALPNPTDFSSEATQSHINNVTSQDGVTSALTTATNGYTPYGLFRFDIIEILTRRYGEGIWMGATSRIERALLCEQYVGYLTAYWRGYGTTPTGNTATLRLGSGSSYFGTIRNHTSGANTTLSIGTSSITSAITWDGYVNVAVYSGASDGVTASYLRTDYIYLDIRVDPFEAVEWKQTGMFFLTEWKNEITNKIVTMTGRDYFSQFSETSYEPMGITNLKTLAHDVLTAGGVPAENQIVDDSLNAITVRPFPERLDCRTAIQHIGIAGVSAVGQDREGNVFIKPFRAIDESSNFINYTTTQPSLWGYVGSGTYLLNDSGGGMKYLDFDQMYSEPVVALEKSIYQVVIKVYSNADADPAERLYINEFIQGTGGSSFTIDNPLIDSPELADNVAKWYIREMNYNAIYTVNWRQNPALECSDMILVEDSFSAEKQTRIIRQEFNYEGYLQGVTESRGGI